mgnify:FL=1
MDVCGADVTPAMTRRALSSGARGSPGLRVCGDPFGVLPPVLFVPEGLEGPGLAGAGLGLAGRLVVGGDLAAVLAGAAAGLPWLWAHAGKLAKNAATRTLVNAKVRAEVEKRMAQGR